MFCENDSCNEFPNVANVDVFTNAVTNYDIPIYEHLNNPKRKYKLNFYDMPGFNKPFDINYYRTEIEPKVDLVIVVFDATQKLSDNVINMVNMIDQTKKVIFVVNKFDDANDEECKIIKAGSMVLWFN